MRRFAIFLTVFIVIVAVTGCHKKSNEDVPPPDNFIRGADLSFLPEIEQWGTQFYTADGTPEDVLTQLYKNGCNTVRVRLWHTPAGLHSSLAEVSAFCQRVHDKGMKVILDIHYSDTWADPGNQATPAAWKKLPLNTLSDSVYKYTLKAVSLIRPEFVQIGNEINGGFMWEQGRISKQADFIQLLKSGVKGARDAGVQTKIIIHFAGLTGSWWFFDLLKTNTVDYDIMALSYYPVWHGKDLNRVQTTLDSLVSLTSKEVMIAETAYPFTLQWNDYTNNILGLESQLVQGYPASASGQLDFMNKLKNILVKTGKGVGFCYWGGEWVAFKGTTAADGSSWENQALFDFSNKALPVMRVFNK
jgi:arabinogalactan endo-1,4-beta-galactosidase